MSILDELNKLAETLDKAVENKVNPPRKPDAIDRVLSESPRTTQVVSVRESAEMEAFRQAVVDGLIQNDAVRQLLALVNTVLTKVLVP
jgi:hypothetical protein